MTHGMSEGGAGFGPWSIDFRLNRLLLRGTRTPFPPKSMAVLVYLLRNNDRFVPAEELLRELWPGRVTEESTIHRRINLIRKVLGDSSKSPIYIENEPRQGYRFIAEVEYLADGTRTADAPPSQMPPETVQRFPLTRLSWLAVIVCVAVALAIGLWRDPDQGLDFNVQSVAVLPLQDLSEQGELPWLTRGIAKNLNQRLRSTGVISVPSDLAIERVYDRGGAPREIARELGVKTLVSGYVQQLSTDHAPSDAATFAIHLEVSDAQSNRVLWSQEVQGAQDNLLLLQSHIVDLVTGFLGLRVPGPAPRPMPSTPQAYAAYLKFLYFESQELSGESLEWIEQTVALEPSFGFGHVQAGWAYTEMYSRTMDQRYRERAVAAYERARDLGMASDPYWLNAWGGYLSRFESRHREAESYLREAAEGGVPTQYIHLLLASGLYEAGRDAALHSLLRNPTHNDERIYLNVAYGLLGNYSAMLEAARAAIAVYPDGVIHRSHEMSALIRLGRLDEAEAAYEELTRALIRLGRLNEGDYALENLVPGEPSDELALSFPRGRFAAARGQREEALEQAALLERYGVTASAGLIYLILADPRGEAYLRSALQPFYINLPFRLATLAESIRTNESVLAGVHDYGYDPAWKAELCGLAATMPAHTGISCDVGASLED